MRRPRKSPPRTFDRRLYQLINRLPHTAAGDRRLSLLSDLGKGAGWVGVSACLELLGGPRGRRAGISATVSMLAAIGLSQGLLKGMLKRRRPFASEIFAKLTVVVGPEGTDPSFPSGHASGSFAAAASLAAFYPRQAPALLATAAAVGLSRVYLGHHFPSDVIAGAALGTGVGLLGARLGDSV
ncbi:MAG: phosphatase PAP2 family protein [Candidatus Dormibacteraceae bacterium]